MTLTFDKAAAAASADIDRVTLYRWESRKPWLYAAIGEKMNRQEAAATLENNEMVARARLFSRAAHQAVGQARKYTGEPYFLHPVAVAEIVGTAKDATPDMVAAAHLHDVVEDTGITHHEIHDAFGEGVAGLVLDVTNQYTEPRHGYRSTRKRKEQERLAGIRPQAQTIKYADMIHNIATIADHDPVFARKYLKEKRALLKVMADGDLALWQWALSLIDKHTAQLEKQKGGA